MSWLLKRKFLSIFSGGVGVGKGGYERTLSATERIWLAADRITPPFAVPLVLEGEGKLDVKAWKIAVDRAAEANPGMRAVLKGTLKRTRWVDCGVAPPVREIDGNAWDGHGPEGAPFLQRTIFPLSGPTTEVLLLSGAQPRVIFRAPHALTDGRGMLCFVEDVFRVLRGEDPIGTDSTLKDLSLARSLGSGDAMKRVKDCLTPSGAIASADPGVRWRRVTLTGHPSRLLPRVVLAVARSAWGQLDHGDSGRVRIEIPVDMRPKQPGLRSTGNLTGMLYMDIPPDADEDSITTEILALLESVDEARIIKGLEALSSLPVWLIAWLGKLALKNIHHKGRFRSSAVVSNLGRLPLAKFQGGGFSARTGFFIPPGADTQPFFLAMCGNGEGVEFVASMPRVLATDGRLERLLESLIDNLR